MNLLTPSHPSPRLLRLPSAPADRQVCPVRPAALPLVLAAWLLLCLSSLLQGQPVIFTQPQNQSAIEGGTVTFSVVASGSAPLSYQWRSYANQTGFTDISGATGSTLVIANVTATSRRFGVLVTDVNGSVVSQLATLTVRPPPAALLSASSATGGDIGLLFSRPMLAAGLNLPTNYQVVAGGVSIPVASALPWPGNTSVVLSVSQPPLNSSSERSKSFSLNPIPIRMVLALDSRRYSSKFSSSSTTCP